MKRNELLELGISRKTLDDAYIPLERVVVSEAFAEPTNPGVNYREKAIDRLVSLRLPFRSESNIQFNMAYRYVKVTCPYDLEEMKPGGGHGSAGISTIEYHCTCGAKASLTMTDDGISMRPTEKEGR
mgnify:CR=1 FL=1